ncbi:MAG: CDP-alcohol phosphatidyltransferase family protein [Thermoplasmatota archaeon]
MVLEDKRHWLDAFFDPLASLFKDVHPNTFTLLSVVFAFIAGAAYGLAGYYVPGTEGHGYPFLLMVGLLFVGFNSIADTLDGRVARMHGKSSTVGDFLDHTMDRVSDVVILLGIAFSSYCNTIFGLMAVLFVLLSSYMGTQAQAVGVGRNYSGVMGRADRMVLLMVLTPLQFLIEVIWGVKGWDPFGLAGHEITPLEVILLIMMVGGGLTFIQRWWETYRALVQRDREEAGKKDLDHRRRGNNRTSPRVKRSMK